MGNIKESTIKNLNTFIDFDTSNENYDNVLIMTLTVADLDPPNDSLAIIYLELIDREPPEHIEIPTFKMMTQLSNTFSQSTKKHAPPMNPITMSTIKRVPSLLVAK